MSLSAQTFENTQNKDHSKLHPLRTNHATCYFFGDPSGTGALNVPRLFVNTADYILFKTFNLKKNGSAKTYLLINTPHNNIFGKLFTEEVSHCFLI